MPKDGWRALKNRAGAVRKHVTEGGHRAVQTRQASTSQRKAKACMAAAVKRSQTRGGPGRPGRQGARPQGHLWLGQAAAGSRQSRCSSGHQPRPQGRPAPGGPEELGSFRRRASGKATGRAKSRWERGTALRARSVSGAVPQGQAVSNDLNATVVQAVNRGIQIAHKGVGCDARSGLAASPRSSERAAATAQGAGPGASCTMVAAPSTRCWWMRASRTPPVPLLIALTQAT